MTNAKNVRVKPVEIEIDDKKYYIKYDFNAFIELEDMYGSVEGAMEKIQGEIVNGENGEPVMVKIKDDNGKETEVPKRKFSIKGMRDLLWCGLLYKDPNITKRQVGQMLEFANFEYISSRMMEAFTSSIPEKVDDEKN